MSYEIKIAGLDDAIITENSAAMDLIRQSWINMKLGKSQNKAIEIGAWTGDLKSIRYFKKTSIVRQENSLADVVQAQYVYGIQQIRNLAPDVRAQRLSFFHVIYWGFMKLHIEDCPDHESIDSDATWLQYVFYKANPNRTVPDPSIFRPMIGARSCDDAAFRFIENHVRQDIFAENHL